MCTVEPWSKLRKASRDFSQRENLNLIKVVYRLASPFKAKYFAFLVLPACEVRKKPTEQRSIATLINPEKRRNMKYYIIADPHAFYKETIKALKEKGYFSDTGPKKIIICGDLFDRGTQVKEMESFILDLLDKDEVILIRGNHEDLMLDLVYKIKAYIPCVEYTHHGTNGTFKTAVAMSGMKPKEINAFPDEFTLKMKASPLLKRIIPAMVNYYETDNYIFVHGWIPCIEKRYRRGESIYQPTKNWRGASATEWNDARWYNGMAAARCGVIEKGKTIVCGHFRTSWGHSVINGEGEDYGPKGIYTPYLNDGIIALDACTSYSKFVNCLVIED